MSIVVGTATLAGLFHRYVVRPVRQAFRYLAGVLADVREAAHSTEELFKLAGAVTNFAVTTNARLDALETGSVEREERLVDLAELLTDALADLERMRIATEQRGRRSAAAEPEGEPG